MLRNSTVAIIVKLSQLHVERYTNAPGFLNNLMNHVITMISVQIKPLHYNYKH